MKTEIPYQLIEDLKQLDDWAYLEDLAIFQTNWSDKYARKNIKVDTSIDGISIETLSKMQQELQKRLDDKTYSFPLDSYTEQRYKSFVQKLNWHEKNKDKVSEIKLRNIKMLPGEMEKYFNNEQSDHDRIFYIEDEFGSQPYLFTGVRYTGPTKHNHAYTTFTFRALLLGNQTEYSKSLYGLPLSGDEKFITVERLFDILNVQLADDALREDYEAKTELASKLMNSVGEVYDSKLFKLSYTGRFGTGKTIDTTTNKSISPILVLDTPYYIKEIGYNRSSSNSTTSTYAFGSEEVKLPIHTILAGYHLSSHSWCTFDVESLTPHVFAGPELMDKLIIEDMDKNLVNMLIEQSTLQMDDIISGKQGGSFMLATGLPGTGKTLTAEVLAESIGLPLYTVQCSQLGLNPDTIEKELLEILKNAERWKAVLQIDEADVYIRERGLDLQHNAIVGAFLRILEKANCIIFMTTNIESIDDAIKSRATAILRYHLPDTSKLLRIFEVLSKQFKVELDFDPAEIFTNSEPIYSGRDVKSFMKLAKMQMSSKKINSLSLEDAKMILTYIK